MSNYLWKAVLDHEILNQLPPEKMGAIISWLTHQQVLDAIEAAKLKHEEYEIKYEGGINK